MNINSGLSEEDLLDRLPRPELLDVLKKNPSFKGMFLGYVAERELEYLVRNIVGVRSVSKIPDSEKQKGDLLVDYLGKKITIEVKCLLTNKARDNFIQGGIDGRVGIKLSDSMTLEDGSKTTCLEPNQFDILAVCLAGVTGEWNFLFIENKYLPRSETHPDRLRTTFSLNTENTPCLHRDLLRVLKDLG